MPARTKPSAKPWSLDDIQTLIDLRRTNPPTMWQEIAMRLHRPARSCHQKFNDILNGITGYRPHEADSPAAPEAIAAGVNLERARKRQTPVQRHMGDPAPGYSAYDAPSIETDSLYAWCLDCGQSAKLTQGDYLIPGRMISLRDAEAVYDMLHCSYCGASPVRQIPAPRHIKPIEIDGKPIKYTALVLSINKKRGAA
jgi:hypothetical protein